MDKRNGTRCLLMKGDKFRLNSPVKKEISCKIALNSLLVVFISIFLQLVFYLLTM